MISCSGASHSPQREPPGSPRRPRSQNQTRLELECATKTGTALTSFRAAHCQKARHQPVTISMVFSPVGLVLGFVPIPPVVGAGIPDSGAVVVPIPAAWVCKQEVPGSIQHARDTPGPNSASRLPEEPPSPPKSAGPQEMGVRQRTWLELACTMTPNGHRLVFSQYTCF